MNAIVHSELLADHIWYQRMFQYIVEEGLYYLLILNVFFPSPPKIWSIWIQMLAQPVTHKILAADYAVQ